MSKPSTKPQIRKLLRAANPTGLTIQQICVLTGRPVQGVRNTLNHMPDVYIALWKKQKPGSPPEAVYRAVEVPANAPYPVGRRAEKEAARIANRKEQNKEIQELHQETDERSKHVQPRFSRI